MLSRRGATRPKFSPSTMTASPRRGDATELNLRSPRARVENVRASISVVARVMMLLHLMQLRAPHQAPGDVSRLQRRALRWRMRGEIAGDRNENMPALVGVAPEAELPDPGLQHLVGVEARVFPKHRMRERGDQRLRRVAKRQVPRHQPCRKINLSLPVERVEQGGRGSPPRRQADRRAAHHPRLERGPEAH